jgi:hypothetical protein
MRHTVSPAPTGADMSPEARAYLDEALAITPPSSWPCARWANTRNGREPGEETVKEAGEPPFSSLGFCPMAPADA